MNLKYFVIFIVFLYWFLQLCQLSDQQAFTNNKVSLSIKSFGNQNDILISILNKINQICNKVQITVSSSTTSRSTTARLLTLSACGCYAVSMCSNLVDAAGTRAFQSTPTTPCPYGTLYCCPTTPTTTTAAATTTTTTTLAPTTTTTVAPTTTTTVAPTTTTTVAPTTTTTVAPTTTTTVAPTTTTTVAPTNTRTVCACFNVTSCTSLVDGSNVIDLRIVTPQCPNGTIYCCINITTSVVPMVPTTTTTMAPTTTTMAPTTTTMVSTTTTTMAPTTTTTMAPTTTTTMAPTTTTTMAPTTTTSMAPTTTTTMAPTTTTTMAPTTTTTMTPTTTTTMAPTTTTMAPTTTTAAPTTTTAAPTTTTMAPTTTTAAPTTTTTTMAPTTTTTTTTVAPTTTTMAPTTTTVQPTTTTPSTVTMANPNACGCYNVTDCQSLTDGRDQIDFRIVTPQCPSGSIYCCVAVYSTFAPIGTINPSTTVAPTTMVPTTTTMAPSTTTMAPSTTTMAPTTTTMAPPTTTMVPATMAPTTTTMVPATVAPPTATIMADPLFCGCYTVNDCQAITDGRGQIDLRIVNPTCPNGTIYCCIANVTAPTTMAAGSETNVVNVTGCGIRLNIPSNLTTSNSQARYGDYPWIAAILTRQNEFVATGVLISNRYVLTVAHRIYEYILTENADTELKVRLGDWDAVRSVEPIIPQEYNIIDIVTHPNYNPLDLHNDLAVIEITPNVRLGTAASINTACLPQSPTTTYIGRNCWVAGWGLDMLVQGAVMQAILREVTVPVIDSATCQNLLRQSELGSNFELYSSFLCAGGRPMMDACVGDGGSPLTCEGPNGQWTVVGLVSWGVRCGELNVPGVYTNIAALLPWLNTQIS